MAHPVQYSYYPASSSYYPAGRQHFKDRSEDRSDSQELGFNPATPTLFSDRSIRRQFIRKVYGIITVQLLFTLGVIAVFVFSESVKSFVQQHRWVMYISIAAYVTTFLALLCVESCRRKTPRNYICLAIYTISLSFLTGAMSSKYDTDIVFITVAITALVTLSLTIFAIQTKVDFTACSGFLCVATIVLVVLGAASGIVVALYGYSKILNLVYAGLAALLFSLYLVYDTQLLIGGKRFSLSEEEYVMAALQIYLDIVMLFCYLLQIFGLASE